MLELRTTVEIRGRNYEAIFRDKWLELRSCHVLNSNQGGALWIISTGVSPHHVAYGSRTTRLRAVIGVSSVLSVLLFAYPVPFTYLSRPLVPQSFSFRGAPVCSIQVAQKGVRAAGGN